MPGTMASKAQAYRSGKKNQFDGGGRHSVCGGAYGFDGSRRILCDAQGWHNIDCLFRMPNSCSKKKLDK